MVHVLYTATIGVSLYQQLTKVKAFLSIVLIPIILFIIVGVLMGAGFAVVSSMFGGL